MIPDEKKKTKKVAAPKGLAKFPKLDIWAAPPAHATTFTAPVTHHVPVTAADQSLAALISALGSGGNSAQVAASMAAHDVQAELAALRQAQAQANAAAASRASQIGGLASQAAQFTSGLGDQTAAQYRSALADTQGLASGFSDMARADADAQAAAAQQQIAASGGSAPVSNEGSALANVLYGLGGKLPGDVIQAQGIGSTAAARMVPVSLLQYGQQGAAGALQAGAEQAAAYQPDITRAIGSQGSLAQQYLSALESSRQNQLGNMIEAYKLQQSSGPAAAKLHFGAGGEILQINPNGKITVIRKATGGSSGDHYYSDAAGNDYVRHADGTVTQLPGQARAATPTRMTTVSDANGTYLLDPYTGKRGAKVAGPSSSAKTAAAAARKPVMIGSADRGYSWLYPNGKIKPLPGKLGKPAATTSGSGTSSTVFNRAVKVAQIAYSGPKTNPGPIPWNSALTRVRAYMLGAGVSRKRATAEAKRALLAAGYVQPLPKPKRSFLADPQAWAAYLASQGGASGGGSSSLGSGLFG